MDSSFRDKLAAAVALAEPAYDERRRLTGGKPAAVLMLFGVSAASPSEQQLLVTRRTDSVGAHKGQMAFPGGTCEPQELSAGDQGMIGAALRETQEEVGIPVTAVAPVGRLPELTTITQFRVTPVVGMLREPIEEFPLKLNPDEIAQAFWVRLSQLREPGVYRTEYIRVGPVNYPVHVYQVGEHRIWGATAAMIKNLLDRLAALG
jgi:8-oxo-dGTP pyrophosphatase MutT (NUDIX family)